MIEAFTDEKSYDNKTVILVIQRKQEISSVTLPTDRGSQDSSIDYLQFVVDSF